MKIFELKLKTYDGKEYPVDVFLNLKSMRAIEKELKELNPEYGFFKSLPLVDQAEMDVVSIYVTNVVHKKGEQRPLGADFFDNHQIDFFACYQEVIQTLVQCMEDNKPTTEEEKK